jgi:tRNA threonylcarbamoyladenosine biosynthesis protein TsaB
VRILAADTSTDILTVGLCADGELLAHTVTRCGRAHSERLLETTQWVLTEAGLTLTDLDALAIAHGPGSFTGLRIGVATWKGLALGASKPLVAVPTLDAIARTAVGCVGPLCVALDAKMGEVFGAWFDGSASGLARTGPDRVCTMEALLEGAPAGAVYLGDGATRYADAILTFDPTAWLLPETLAGPRAWAVALEGQARLEAGADGDPALVSPVYLRKSQAELNRERALQG